MGSCVSVSVTVEGGPCFPISESNGANGNGKRRRRNRGRAHAQARAQAVQALPGTPPLSSSFDYNSRMDEVRLLRVPGRMFLNGSTHFASLYCRKGRKRVNQDAMLLWENLCSSEGTVFCGVFDGHGPHGHRVAKKVRDFFPLRLMAEWDLHPNNNKHGLTDTVDAAASADPDPNNNNLAAVRESFVKACKVMDKELKLQHDFDCYCSGTTAVTLVKQGQHLIIGNVGDSRAVLCTRDPDDDSLTAVQLTTDFKPNLPREAERIRMCKGRVFALANEPEVARVWLPNIDSPGLAMARAFGDFCLKDFGVISLPDVSYHRITDKDEFVVLATDGVWDVLSNSQVVAIVASAPRSFAARLVVDTAVQAWRTKHPSSKIDDCSVICLFFDSDSTVPEDEAPIDDHKSDSDSDSDVCTSLSVANTLVDHCPHPSRTTTTTTAT